jgi:hypothetical protein
MAVLSSGEGANSAPLETGYSQLVSQYIKQHRGDRSKFASSSGLMAIAKE